MLFNSVFFCGLVFLSAALTDIVALKFRRYVFLFTSLVFLSVLGLHAFLMATGLSVLAWMGSRVLNQSPSREKLQWVFAGLLLLFIVSLKIWVLQSGQSWWWTLGLSYLYLQVLSLWFWASKAPAEKASLLEVVIYLLYFPKFVAGPLERPSHFIHQLRAPGIVTGNQQFMGVLLILVGFVKKNVIADNLVYLIDPILRNLPAANLGHHLQAFLLMPFELYFNFAGYSDIAVGLGVLMGLELTENFRNPFWSRNIAEYWQRWHRSLTLWFFEHIFYPVTKKSPVWGVFVAAPLVFMLSAVWHGTQVGYLIWGALHSLMYVTWFVLSRGRPSSTVYRPLDYVKVAGNFLFVIFAMNFFIMQDASFMASLWQKIAQTGAHQFSWRWTESLISEQRIFFGLIVVGFYEWGRRRKVAIERPGIWMTASSVTLILAFLLGSALYVQPFIYAGF